ncbi:MAG: PilZ domain-containing protein [Deltaproteobacteria bacterium]|jgi:hypothetical protein|nr:PilZ domain-containing protein [Deltaproteobacteria bacterium]
MTCKRRYTRFAIDAEVSVSLDGGVIHGRAVDIGMGGVRLTSSASIPIGAEVVLRLALPEITGDWEIPCIVRWSDRALGAGLQFARLGADEFFGLSHLADHFRPIRV